MFNLNGELIDDVKLNVSLEDNASVKEMSEYIDSILVIDDNIKQLVNDHTEMINSGESELVLSMEGLRRLELVQNNLIKINGISQTLGLEAISICPDLNINIKKLTNDITLINYRVSLEEIDKKLIGMIAAAVVAIGAILYKIVQWFRGKDKDQVANATPEKKAEINKEAENAETQITTLVNNVNKGVSKDTATIKQEITPAVIDTLGVKADQAKTPEQEEKAQSRLRLIKAINSGNFNNIGEMLETLHKAKCDLPLVSKFMNAIENMDSVERDIIRNGPFTKAVENCIPVLTALIPEYQDILTRVTNYQKNIKMKVKITDVEKTKMDIENLDKDILDGLEKVNNEIDILIEGRDKASENSTPITIKEVVEFCSNANMRYIDATNKSIDLVSKLQNALEKAQVDFDNSKLPVDTIQEYYDDSSYGNIAEFANQYRTMLSQIATFNIKYAKVLTYPDIWVNNRDKIFATGMLGLETYMSMMKEVQAALKDVGLSNEKFNDLADTYARHIAKTRMTTVNKDLDSLKDANIPGCRNRFAYASRRFVQKLSSIVSFND